MTALTPLQSLVILADTFFVLGLISFATGLVVLYRAAAADAARLAVQQTARVVRKAAFENLTESMAQASALLTTLYDLTQTNRGIGLVLLLTGIALMSAAGGLFFWLAGRAA